MMDIFPENQSCVPPQMHIPTKNSQKERELIIEDITFHWLVCWALINSLQVNNMCANNLSLLENESQHKTGLKYSSCGETETEPEAS